MSKSLKIILLVLAAVFIIIQLIPANRPANEPTDYNFFLANEVPEEIESMIKKNIVNHRSTFAVQHDLD